MTGWLLKDKMQAAFDENPEFKKWHETMVNRPATKKVLDEKAKAS